MDIPQGSYSEINLHFLSGSSENFSMFLDYDHPDQGQDNHDVDVNIIFSLMEVGPLPILDKDGSKQHLIAKDNEYQLYVNLNPDVLFENINLSSWNGIINSQSNPGQGNSDVNISDDLNQNIHEQLIKNINKSFEITLDNN